MKPTKTPRRFAPSMVQLEDRDVPAVFYVDPTLPASGTGTWNGATETKTVTIGVDGFQSLASALQAAALTPAETDQIMLSKGTIPLGLGTDGTTAPNAGNLTIATPVDLIGSGASLTKLVPVADTSTEATTTLSFSGAANPVTVTGVTFDGAGFNIGGAMLYTGGSSGSVKSSTITNVKFGSTGGVGITAFNSTKGVVVQGDTINNYGRVGVLAENSVISVLANTIDGSGASNPVNYGLLLRGTTDATVTGNQFSGNLSKDGTGDFVAASIGAEQTAAGAPVAKVFANKFSGSDTAVVVGSADGDASKITISVNVYSDLAVGLTAVGTTNPVNEPFGNVSGLSSNAQGNAAIAPTTAAIQLLDANGNPFTSAAAAQATASPSSTTFLASAGTGGTGQVQVLNGTGATVGSATTPLGTTSNGTRVALADVNGDGVLDQIIGSGPGGVSRVLVLNGATGATIADFQPFEAGFTGGVFVAGGDLNLDGKADVAVAPDEGGGARVVVYNGATLTGANSPKLADFLGLADAFASPGFPNGKTDSAFRGGVRPAIGDVNGDGRVDLAVSAGFLGGPRITLWNGETIAAANGASPTALPLANFFVFEQSVRDGVFLSIADFNGDGYGDIVAGGGPNGGPRVRGLSGKEVISLATFDTDATVTSNTSLQIINFFAGADTTRGGVRVLGRNIDAATDLPELITATGDGEPGSVSLYQASAIVGNLSSPNAYAKTSLFSGEDLTSGGTLSGGVYVG